MPVALSVSVLEATAGLACGAPVAPHVVAHLRAELLLAASAILVHENPSHSRDFFLRIRFPWGGCVELLQDGQDVVVIKEGEDFHVEVSVEIDPGMTVAEMDDIKDRLKSKILQEKGVVDVLVDFDEDDGVQTWRKSSEPLKEVYEEK